MNRLIFKLAFALLWGATPAAFAQTLINVDFSGVTATRHSGPAGAGLGTNDVWNAYSHYVPRFTPGMPAAPDGRLEGLTLADGTASRVAVAVTNAPGVWGNSSGDPMFDSFIFAPNGSPLTVAVTGLDPGSFHFFLYGHADADVSPEQNSVFTLRTFGARPLVKGPLTSAGATGWRAGQPWQEGRQYVVFRDVTVTSNEPVVLEVAPGPGGVAVLNGLQILSRGTAPPRLAATDPTPVASAVTNLLFREIRYDGLLGAGDVRFKVAVQVESRSTNELSTRLFEGDLALLAPRLPVGWRIVNDGRHFVLTAGAPGSHTLEFELAARVTRSEPWNQVSFAGPPAAIASVTLTGPPGTEIQLLSGTLVEEESRSARSGARKTPTPTPTPTVRGALGADSHLSFRWQERAAEVAREALVTADTHSVVQLTPSVIRHTTTLRYDVLQGRLGQVRLRIPSEQALTKLEGDALREWKVEMEDGQPTLRVEFLRPVESGTTLMVFTEQPVPGLPVLVNLAVPQPLDLQRETGSLNIGVEDIVARVEETAGLRQVNAAAEDMVAFRFSARPVSVRVALTRVEPVVNVFARIQASLEESRLLVRHDLTLNVARAGIYTLDLSLPAGFAVTEVSGEGVEDWNASNGKLHLGFAQRVLGERKISVQLEQALSPTAGDLVLTPLRLSGAAKETTFIGARALAGLNLKTAALEGVREIPVAALPDHQDDLLAYRADSGDWRLRLGVERLSARLVGEVFNLITVGDGLVGGSATLRFAIVNQGVQAFRVRLPAHWRNVEFTGPNLRRTDRQGDVWTLALQDKAWGAYTLVITYDYTFDPKQAVLDAAGAHPLDVEREDGTVAVTAAPGLEVTSDPVADPVRVIDPTELSPMDRALITRPVLLAYRYVGTNFALSLKVARHDQVAGLEAVSDRAQLTSVLTGRGEMLTQASFMVKNNERQYQRFQLPPGATLWGVAVNNEPVKADRDGDWVLISLPRDADRDRTFAVDLNYAQQVGDLGRLGGALPRALDLIAPRTDVPGTYAEWELYTPPAKRVAGFGGNMTVARGTLYSFRDGWDRFVDVYAAAWHRFGPALIFSTVFVGFFTSLWVLGRRKGFGGLVQVLVVFAFLTVLAGMLLPALSKAKAKSNRISSVNNLKNIGLAARIYATDHKGKMPEGFADMMNELSTEKILVHPTTGERYTWVGAGKSEEQPDSILAYGPAVQGGREVLLGDGSVQQVTAARFDELLARELNRKDSAALAYQMDPILARRYGLSPRKAGETLAESRLQQQTPTTPALAAVTPPVPTVTPSSPAPASAPTVAGLRSLKIEIPKSGRPYQFTRVLNLNGEPPSLRVSVMSAKAFIIERTLLQLVTFIVGLVLVGWQWRRAEPKAVWLAVGAGLALVATANLFIAWRALHLVLIVSVPAVLFLVIAWCLSRWWKARQRTAPVMKPTDPSAAHSAPPVGPVAGATASALLWLAASGWVAPNPTVAAPADGALTGGLEARSPVVTPVRSNIVSVIGATLTGAAQEHVARIEAALEFSSAGTNQAISLFGKDVAVQEFAATTGDVRLWRDGESVGVLLPAPGAAAARLTLLVKLGGDVGRRTLDFGIPPALGTRLTLLLDEPDAEVEFPGAITFSRTNHGTQTRIEAVLGATGRLGLAWTPRFQRASNVGATVFAQQASLVTLANGVVATRSLIEFTTPQGELRSVRIALPSGQRLLRVSGELVRGWDHAGTNRDELVIELLKSAPTVRLILETEALLESLPALVTVEVPRPLEVKRTTGTVAVRAGEELGLNVERATGLERIEAAEFAKTFGEEPLNGGSAWRFLQPDFELAVQAEVLTPKVEAIARNAFNVGFEQVGIAAKVDYTVTRPGVFNLRLGLPLDARVESVVSAAMQSWTERTDGAVRVLDLTLKERTLGPVAVEMALTRSLTNLPPLLDLLGVHPLGVSKLGGFVSVSSEPGVGVKVRSQRGLTEIPASALPGPSGGGGVLAFKQLTADPAAAAGWALDVATERIDSWVRAEVAALVSVGETLVSGRSLVRYDIQNAPVKDFRLRVPAAWRNVEITGPGVRRRDQTNGPAGVEWRVELQNKVHGDYQLTVQWEEPRTGTNDVAAAGVEALGVERETGTVAFYSKGQLQLVPRTTGDALLRVDARELPSWAADAARGNAVLSYRYLRPGWMLAIEVKRFSDAALLQALVDQVRLRTVVADDGQMMTQLELSVRNNGRQHLAFTLPPGAEVWSATVDGEPVRPARNGEKLLLPLEVGRGGDAPVRVELTYVGSGRFPRTGGPVELTSPRLDVPLKEATWEVFLPPDHAYTDFGGTMTYESADLVPVAQDFTLASYRRQEMEKLASVELQTVDFLSTARKEVAEGRYESAGRLGFFRSRGLRDESAKRELQELEDTVNLAQSSNLMQAQQAYALNNSLQRGAGVATAAPGGLGAAYEAEVAARQVSQLNRAQAVAVARVSPLRVNLPTHGLRHSFGQVLQTEVDRPLTVSFHARNERQTGWFKTLMLWGGGFLGLWGLSFLAVVIRPAPRGR